MSDRPHERTPSDPSLNLPMADPLVGSHPLVRRAAALVPRLAVGPPYPILIEAETGCGAELVAHAIHRQSLRAARRFAMVACAPLGEDLLAELFGGPHGAPGLVETTAGGTLFIDQPAEASPAAQPRLARLAAGFWRPGVREGGAGERRAELRLIAATAVDLAAAVGSGAMRADLHLALRASVVALPPLRERRDELPGMIDELLPRLARRHERAVPAIDGAARTMLLDHDWPGNLRELSQTLDRALVAANGTITVADLALGTTLAPARLPAGQAGEGLVIPPGMRDLATIEGIVVRAVLAETGNQKTRAAAMLGINRTTLYNKLRALGL